MKVSIQGQEASYHEAVALRLFNNQDIVYKETFSDVFDSILNGECDKAVVAIANNRYGFIPDTYRELIDHCSDIWVSGEYYLLIEHQLLGIRGVKLSDIKEIVSQSAATGQCNKFLESRLPTVSILEYFDTAASARMVSENGSISLAAIASREAAKMYDLDIIQANIQDDPDNITRFLVIEKNVVDHIEAREATGIKYTAILSTGQKPGSLVDVLSIFKKANINITNLHSSFIPNTSFHIQFFIEFETSDSDWPVSRLLKEVAKFHANLNIIGNYKPASL